MCKASPVSVVAALLVERPMLEQLALVLLGVAER